MTFLIVLVGWIFSLCLHEFLHALVAYLGGDTTVRDKGYLTFNLFKYTHPVYSLLLPLLFLVLGGLGLPGGAVYIETWRLRSRKWVSAVALAGPLSNLVLALTLSVMLWVFPLSPKGIWPGLAFLALLQISAFVLNLIPVPPFDGYGVIEPFLNRNLSQKIARMQGGLLLVVFLVLWYLPFVNNLFWNLVFGIANVMHVPLDLIRLGYSQFLFWRKL